MSPVTQLPTGDSRTDPPKETSNLAPHLPLWLPDVSQEAEVFPRWGRVVQWLSTPALKPVSESWGA